MPCILHTLKKEYNAIFEKMFKEKEKKAELFGSNSLTGGNGMKLILKF